MNQKRIWYVVRCVSVLLMTLLVWFGSAHAQQIDPNLRICMVDSLRNFWVIHISGTTPGDFAGWGHMHDPAFRGGRCWTKYLMLSGAIYQPGHRREYEAEFGGATMAAHRGCPAVVIEVTGDIREQPIVYRGTIRVGSKTVSNYSMTVLGDCLGHP